MKTTFVSGICALTLLVTPVMAQTPPQQQQPPKTPPAQQEHQHPPDQAGGDMAARCQAMMKDHDKMMADMKAADQKLDPLVAKMNAATGQAKTDATAATVTELVAQRKQRHEMMMKMQHGAMTHMMEHMQAGPQSMSNCPMMKGMPHQK